MTTSNAVNCTVLCRPTQLFSVAITLFLLSLHANLCVLFIRYTCCLQRTHDFGLLRIFLID